MFVDHLFLHEQCLHAVYEDDRTSVALRLMDYIAKSGLQSRRDMYCRYVQYLVDLHVGLKNHVEVWLLYRDVCATL